MASKKSTTTTTKTNTSQPIGRGKQNRQSITFEMVRAHAPHAALAANLSRTFGIDPVDYDAIRDKTEEQIGLSALALKSDLHEKALAIHLQRVVGAFVGSAYSAAGFYQRKVTDARDLSSKAQNDDRDEDRDGIFGFESKAQRARAFAAQTGLQAHALMAAAEGAVNAYAAITGDDWKPYTPDSTPTANVARQSAAAELEAFG